VFQLPISAVNVALPAFDAVVPAVQQLMDTSYPPGPKQQTCQMLNNSEKIENH